MGNSLICSPFEYFKNVNICFQAQTIEKKENQLIINIENEKDKYEGKMTQLKNYFNENEKELFCNYYNKKEKTKKQFNKKKHNNALNKLSENKYELMLKRLLEQKEVKRNGPKRRETIRTEKKIKLLVNEVLMQNLEDIKNKKLNDNSLLNNEEGDLLIKNINNAKYRNSATIDKKSVITNKINNKLKADNYLQYRNTINEIINEGSGYSNYCKKKTKPTNSSPPNKK
jgi:hypothetical protein